MYFQEFLTPYGGKRSAVWAGRFDIFQTRPNIISIALALCYFGATILKSFPEAGLDHFTFLYHNYYSSPFRNKNTAAKSLRCKAFTMLIYIKIDRPLPWRSVNLSWRRWRDLNPRTPCGAYRISNPDPSATWVHLHILLPAILCHRFSCNARLALLPHRILYEHNTFWKMESIKRSGLGTSDKAAIY